MAIGTRTDADDVRNIDRFALERAHVDIMRVLDRSLDIQTKIGDKSMSIVQVNGVILTILIGAGVQTGFSTYLNFLTILGVFSILLSMIAGIIGYLTKMVHIGIGANDVSVPINYRLSGEEYLEWIIEKGYANWVREIEEVNNNKEKWLQIAIGGFAVGMVLIITGIFISVGL